MEVVIKDKELKDDQGLPTKMIEIEHIIKKVDLWNLCAGGPSSDFAANVRSKINVLSEIMYFYVFICLHFFEKNEHRLQKSESNKLAKEARLKTK